MINLESPSFVPRCTTIHQMPRYRTAGEKTVNANRWSRKWTAEDTSAATERAKNVVECNVADVDDDEAFESERRDKARKTGPEKFERYVWTVTRGNEYAARPLYACERSTLSCEKAVVSPLFLDAPKKQRGENSDDLRSERV